MPYNLRQRPGTTEEKVRKAEDAYARVADDPRVELFADPQNIPTRLIKWAMSYTRDALNVLRDSVMKADLLRNISLFNVLLAEANEDRPNQAVVFYTQAAKANYKAGTIYRRSGHPEAAEAFLEAGNCHEEAGNKMLAADSYRMVRTDPSDAPAHIIRDARMAEIDSRDARVAARERVRQQRDRSPSPQR